MKLSGAGPEDSAKTLRKPGTQNVNMVGDAGFEPAASAVWRQRSPPALIARYYFIFYQPATFPAYQRSPTACPDLSGS